MTVAGALHLVAAEKQLTDETVRPGLIGLFFFVALFVALYFLWRSMNKQLKKADAHFAAEDAAEAKLQEDAAEDAAAVEAEAKRVVDNAQRPDEGTDSAGEAADR